MILNNTKLNSMTRPALTLNRSSAAPGLRTSEHHSPGDRVSLTSQVSAEPPRKGVGKALLATGLVAVAGLVTLGAATPAAAHSISCGVQTQSYSQVDGWGRLHTVQETFNTCTGEHTTQDLSTGQWQSHYDRGTSCNGNWRVYGNHNHGHSHSHGHHDHHDHHDVEEVVGGFILGAIIGGILSQ